MTNLPPSFARTLGETTYTVDPGQLYLALFSAGLALVLLVALLFTSRGHVGALVAPLVPALAVPFVGLYVLAYATRSVAWSGGDAHRATAVFRDVVVLDGVAAAVGIGAAVTAVLVLALRTANHLRVLRLALPCAMLGVAALLSGLHHADSLTAVGSMPFYGVEGERSMHVGHDRDVHVRLMRAPVRRFWSGMEDGPRPVDGDVRDAWTHADRVHVHATDDGLVPFTAVAHRGPVTLTTKLGIEALPETSSPLLALRVGDRAVYRVRARSSGGAVLFFIPLSGRESVHEVTVDVATTREREGLRTFVLAVSRDGVRREVEVVAINGETRLYDVESGKVGAPLVALLGAAPETSETHRSSTAGSIATAFVAMITIGLVILPDGSSSTSYALASTDRGPDGAPEAQPGSHRATLPVP